MSDPYVFALDRPEETEIQSAVEERAARLLANCIQELDPGAVASTGSGPNTNGGWPYA